MSRRWLRLDVAWDASDWLVTLEPAAQLAWVKLLGWVKVHGKAGRCKAMSPVAAGVKWSLPADAVASMLKAAQAGGVLVVEDREWVAVDWNQYIPPRVQFVPNAWKLVRLKVLERDDWTCRYCGQHADQCDHVVPRAQGGTDDPSNLVAACGRCNRRKGSRTPQEWAHANA